MDAWKYCNYFSCSTRYFRVPIKYLFIVIGGHLSLLPYQDKEKCGSPFSVSAHSGIVLVLVLMIKLKMKNKQFPVVSFLSTVYVFWEDYSSKNQL